MGWDIIGHEWAVKMLKEHVTQGRLRHAYLFTGAPGVGRRTLALRFSQAINCLEPVSPGEPCRTCRSCKTIENMTHPDLVVVQAEQINSALRVNQIREVQHNLSLTPFEARFRVALFLRFEEANQHAANALLKTLEEPPPQVIIMLTAESGEQLLPTIESRCEMIRLRPAPLEIVGQGLINRWGVSMESAKLLTHLSNGRPGQAIRWHQHPELLEQRRALIMDLYKLMKAGRVDRFAFAQSITTDKGDFQTALQTWVSLWRDVLLRISGTSTPLTNLDLSDVIDALANQMSLEKAWSVLSKFDRTFHLLERNVNTRLAAEVLMLDLPQL
jgi:DNA polymerase III subunit delta'